MGEYFWEKAKGFLYYFVKWALIFTTSFGFFFAYIDVSKICSQLRAASIALPLATFFSLTYCGSRIFRCACWLMLVKFLSRTGLWIGHIIISSTISQLVVYRFLENFHANTKSCETCTRGDATMFLGNDDDIMEYLKRLTRTVGICIHYAGVVPTVCGMVFLILLLNHSKGSLIIEGPKIEQKKGKVVMFKFIKKLLIGASGAVFAFTVSSFILQHKHFDSIEHCKSAEKAGKTPLIWLYFYILVSVIFLVLSCLSKRISKLQKIVTEEYFGVTYTNTDANTNNASTNNLNRLTMNLELSNMDAFQEDRGPGGSICQNVPGPEGDVQEAL